MPIEVPPPGTSLVLDTDLFQDSRFSQPYIVAAIRNYQSHFKTLPALTAMTVFEALGGFENAEVNSPAPDERLRSDRKATEQLIGACRVLPFDQASAAVAAYIFYRLSNKNRRKHLKDAFIAATALAHKYGIATRNARDFELISGSLPPTHSPLYVTVWRR